MVVFKYFIHNGELKWRRVVPERFFFDRNCTESDTSDALFWGEFDYMTPSTMFERYQNLSIDERKAIEQEASSTKNSIRQHIHKRWKSTCILDILARLQTIRIRICIR